MTKNKSKIDIFQMLPAQESNELIVLAARPGCGKTAFSLNLIKKGMKTLYISLEMEAMSLMKRLCKINSGTDGTCLDGYELKICDDARQSVKDIERLIINYQPKMVMIDYLQLIDGKKTEISRDLKCLAKKYKLPIICLAQLNRVAAVKEPESYMLAQSGKIEQDADQIGFICEGKLKIAKNRKGRIYSIPMYFDKEHQRFSVPKNKRKSEIQTDWLAQGNKKVKEGDSVDCNAYTLGKDNGYDEPQYEAPEDKEMISIDDMFKFYVNKNIQGS